MTEQAGALGAVIFFADQMVLYCSDTKAPLSVVSDRYQVEQPHEVLELYRDLTEVSSFELETAGVLKAGKKFWALAKKGKESVLKGNDIVNGFLLLATSCDGTLAASCRVMTSARNSAAPPLRADTSALPMSMAASEPARPSVSSRSYKPSGNATLLLAITRSVACRGKPGNPCNPRTHCRYCRPVWRSAAPLL